MDPAEPGAYLHDGFGLWAIVLKEAGELIGDCGLTWQEFDGVQELEVGIT